MLSNIGGAYSSLGQPELALDYFQKELDFNKSRFADADAYTHLYRGNALLDLNREEPALEEYRAAARLWKNDKRGTANVLANIGKIIASHGEKQKALDEYFIPAIKLQKEAGDAYGRAYAMTSAGALLLELGRLDDATQMLNDALQLRIQVGDKKGEIITRYQLARLARAATHPDEAREQLRLAEDSIEVLRGSISDKDLRATYFAGFQQVYGLDVALLVDEYLKKPTQKVAALALQTAESRRARSLLDTLAETKATINAGFDP